MLFFLDNSKKLLFARGHGTDAVLVRWEIIDKTAMQHDESQCFVNEKQNSIVHTAIYQE